MNHPLANKVPDATQVVADRSIWATYYDLEEAHAAEFRVWLNSEFFPSLLRTGKYAWAANYIRVDAPPEWITPDGKPQVGRAEELAGCATENVMLFSASSSTVFLDPLELNGALKPFDPAGMLEMRRNARHSLFIEDVRRYGAGYRSDTPNYPAPAIQFGEYRVRNFEDEYEIGQWASQSRLPMMEAAPECVRARKLMTVAGWSKYGIIYEFLDFEARNHLWARVQEARRAGDPMMQWNVGPKTVHTPGSPFVGIRTYPE